MNIKWKAVGLMGLVGSVISMVLMLLLCAVAAILVVNQSIDVSAISWIGCIVTGIATLAGCIAAYQGLKNNRLIVSLAVATLFALVLMVFGKTVFGGVRTNVLANIAGCFGSVVLFNILGSLGGKRGRRV